MQPKEIMAIKDKGVNAAIWIGRAIGAICFLIIAGYFWGAWV